MARKPNLIGLEKGRKTRSKNIKKRGGKPLTSKERARKNAKILKNNPLWWSILDEEGDEDTKKKE